MIVSWPQRFPRYQKGKYSPSHGSVGCLFPSSPPSSATTHRPFPKPCVLWSGEWNPETLFKPLQWQASLGHCTTMPSSLRARGQLCQNRAECWTHWAPLTNQTVPGSQTALITAVCRNEKDRMNQSDLSGNHSMLFKVNVFVIYKKFPAWLFVWEKKNYNSPPSLLLKSKTNAKNVP